MPPQREAQAIMEVSADIRRSDLVFFNLYILPRMKACWAMFVILTITLLYTFLTSADRVDVRFVGVSVIFSVLLAALAVAVLFLLGLIFSLSTVTEKSGVLGAHVFTLRKDGFYEQTHVNESLHRWRQVHSIVASKHYLFIGINWYIFHVIPARAFASRSEFETFSKLALELRNAAL